MDSVSVPGVAFCSSNVGGIILANLTIQQIDQVMTVACE